MAWNKDKPAGGDKIRLSDDYIRANNEALENAFSEGHEFSTGGNQTGKHTTPTFVDNGGDATQPTGSNEVRLYNNSGKLYSLNQAGSKRSLDPIPAGTKMLFKQNSAPTGWSFVSEDNDRVLINTSTEANGGDTGGSWTINGLSVGNHVLTEDELPSLSGSADFRVGDHTEKSNAFFNESGIISSSGAGTSQKTFEDGSNQTESTERLTVSFGGGNGHNHSISQDGSWRPSYAKVITCQKD
jgi:hypothetical protein